MFQIYSVDHTYIHKELNLNESKAGRSLNEKEKILGVRPIVTKTYEQSSGKVGNGSQF